MSEKLTIQLSSEEAEAVMYALALRYKQAERLKATNEAAKAQAVAERIEQAGIMQAGWDNSTGRFWHWLHPMKPVSVTFYEENKNPKPGLVPLDDKKTT